MVQNKKNMYLDCKVKIDSLIIFLKQRRYSRVYNKQMNNDITDSQLFEKTLYFEACHLASEVIEKLFQLLSQNNQKNVNHSLIIYLNNTNVSKDCIDKIKNLVIKNNNCFVETRYPDYFDFKSNEYDLDELLYIINKLLKEANDLGYIFDYSFLKSEEYKIFSLKSYNFYNRFLDNLISKYSLQKLKNSMNSTCNGFTDKLIIQELESNGIDEKIIVDLIADRNKSDYDKKISGTLEQKYAYEDARTKYYTLDWYLSNIDRIVYGESGENIMDLETNLSMNFINKKSNDDEITQNYIYYNACHLASEAIEKMFKAILLYNGVNYNQMRTTFGHSFKSMFGMLSENQKKLIYNHALIKFSTSQLKNIGIKPSRPDKPFKKYTTKDLDKIYEFDSIDMQDKIISNSLNEIEQNEGNWDIMGKNIFIINQRKGELYLEKLLETMDKAFIETRYPEQFSVNFNYKYNLSYLLEILKSLEHIARLIYEIWRYKNDNMIDYEMNIAKDAHPNLLFERSSFNSPYGNPEYHIVK